MGGGGGGRQREKEAGWGGEGGEEAKLQRPRYPIAPCPASQQIRIVRPFVQAIDYAILLPPGAQADLPTYPVRAARPVGLCLYKIHALKNDPSVPVQKKVRREGLCESRLSRHGVCRCSPGPCRRAVWLSKAS